MVNYNSINNLSDIINLLLAVFFSFFCFCLINQIDSSVNSKGKSVKMFERLGWWKLSKTTNQNGLINIIKNNVIVSEKKTWFQVFRNFSNTSGCITTWTNSNNNIIIIIITISNFKSNFPCL